METRKPNKNNMYNFSKTHLTHCQRYAKIIYRQEKQVKAKYLSGGAGANLLPPELNN